MAYLNGYQYYENSGNNPENENWGSYQYISLSDLVNNFMLMYVGNDKLINNISKYNILFHAKRGIQEINYDALKEIKVLEISICDNLKFVLPNNYVNYVRISLFKNGILRPLSENIQVNHSNSYLQDNNCRVLFDQNGDVLEGTSILDHDRINDSLRTIYLGEGKFSGREGYNIDGRWYFDYNVGSRYGLNTETANSNPTYRIDKQSGVINFSSGMAGELCILEYISDGMANGNDAEVNVHKFAEEFVYRYIKWCLLNAKYGIPMYERKMARDEKQAEFRNAKLRLSNLHPSRLIMTMRGRAQQLK